MGDEDNNQNGQDPEVNTEGHPAWQEILNVLPEELHGLVKPKLAEWDKGVQEQFQRYSPYKDIISNDIPPEFLQQAVGIANSLQEDPENFVEQLIDHFGLDRYRASANEEEEEENEPGSFVDLDDPNTSFEDIMKDPRFKPFIQQQQELMERFQEREEEEEEAEAEEALQEYLSELHDEYGEFDDTYVVAMLANDIDGEVAVKQFQDTVNQAAQALAGNQNNQQTPTPPVVLGAGGTTGSGLPDNKIDFGTMKDQDINKLVTEMLERSQES